jgi:hypothetical protein
MRLDTNFQGENMFKLCVSAREKKMIEREVACYLQERANEIEKGLIEKIDGNWNIINKAREARRVAELEEATKLGDIKATTEYQRGLKDATDQKIIVMQKQLNDMKDLLDKAMNTIIAMSTKSQTPIPTPIINIPADIYSINKNKK